MSSHYAVIGLVEEECARVHILFYENQASLAIAFIPCQAFLLRFSQKFSDIVIGQIAEHPLDPNTVVFGVEIMFL